MQDKHDDKFDADTANMDKDSFIVSDDTVMSSEAYSPHGSIDQLLYKTNTDNPHEWDRNLDNKSCESIDSVDNYNKKSSFRIHAVL